MKLKFKARQIEHNTLGLQGKFYALFDDETHDVDVVTAVFLMYLKDHKIGRRGKSFAGSSSSTIKNYADALCHFLNSMHASKTAPKEWAQIEAKHIRSYLESRAKELAPQSMSLMISRLKGFFDWGMKNGWLPEQAIAWAVNEETARAMTIAQGVTKGNDPQSLFGKYIPEDEFKRLLAFSPRTNSFEKARDEIALSLGYYTGLRRAEVVDPSNVTVGKFEAAEKEADKKAEKEGRGSHLYGLYLDVIGKGGKARTVYIPPSLRRKIRSFIDTDLARKFGGNKAPKSCPIICSVTKNKGVSYRHLGVDHYSHLFADSMNLLIQACDPQDQFWVAGYKTLSAHCLRHSYATNLAYEVLTSGKSFKLVQERLGHTHAETSYIYCHFAAIIFDLKDKEEEYEKLLASADAMNRRMLANRDLEDED